MDVFVAPNDKGILFAETKPRGSEGQGYEPMDCNQRFFDIQDAQCVLPVHPLPTIVGVRFEALLFGITTPVVYTAPAPNPIPVPLLCPLPWGPWFRVPRFHRPWRTRTQSCCRRQGTCTVSSVSK